MSLDRWREILEVLLRRKLRTALTALSVAWGIFMLVVLLSAGNGLSDGVKSTFERDAVNSIWINPGVVSKPYRGIPIGQRVQLYDEDLTLIRRVMPGIETLDARLGVGDKLLRRGALQRRGEVRGCLPERAEVHPMDFTRGRFIDRDDLDDRRRVAVIEARTEKALFAAGEDPLGAWIEVGGSPVQVIGVFEENEDESEQGLVYLPLTTAQLIFGGANGANKINQISFTVTTSTAETKAAVDLLRRTLARRKGFAPDDIRALFIGNKQEMFDQLTSLFAGIQGFVWLVGLGTIVAGVVGVSNIMLISVAERTREIGVRKAVGATPQVIVRMIVEEAMIITMVAGYLGLVGAVGVVNLAAKVMPKTDFFSRPQVNLGVGLAATAVLVVAGTMAGLFPALRAARINPIAALRVE